jgi:predicted esterase
VFFFLFFFTLAMALPTTTRKLRVLALHGYRQNASIFRGRVGHLRKGLKSRADFDFLDAPHPAPLLSDADAAGAPPADADPRSWWLWEDGGPSGRPSLVSSISGWTDATLPLLLATLAAADPPYDGLLGFSQGGASVALLLAALPRERRPKFAVIAGGFLPRDDALAASVRCAAIDTPTLFVAGDADALIPPDRTEALAACFAEGAATWLRHPGGHAVPTCSGAVKAAYIDFLDGVSV